MILKNYILIYQHSKKFRIATEKVSKRLGINFEHFPKGACGDATILLGEYLYQLGFGEFHYILGYDASGASHAWLQKDKLIVDITADQFEGLFQSVIVTTNSEWHKNLNGELENIACIEVYRENNRGFAEKLENLYKTITDHII